MFLDYPAHRALKALVGFQAKMPMEAIKLNVAAKACTLESIIKVD
jgi:hypothetical protein